MDSDIIHAKCKCCACEQPLVSSQFLNWVPLPVPAVAHFPSWGNILDGSKGNGVAYVCDRCYELVESEQGPEIRFSVEFQGNDIVYHAIPEQEIGSHGQS